MSTQPEALRLADELFDGIVFGGVSIELAREAQNELRRLHEVNRMLVEAAEMALDYIEQALQLHDQQYQRHPSTEKDRQAIVDDLETLRQALAQHVDAVNMSQECVDETAKSEQEPVAWMYEWKDEYTGWNKTAHLHKPDFLGDVKNVQPLYTAPPKREWVGLTDEEIENHVKAIWPREATLADFIRSIEAKLKEKNT